MYYHNLGIAYISIIDLLIIDYDYLLSMAVVNMEEQCVQLLVLIKIFNGIAHTKSRNKNDFQQKNE